jgi:small subunit ribosomal protein S18
MARKVKCPIAERNITYIDYKNVALLREFTTRYAKIKPRQYTNVCLANQKALAKAIKRARYMGLLQYVR